MERPSAEQVFKLKLFQTGEDIFSKRFSKAIGLTKTKTNNNLNATKMNIDMLTYLMQIATIKETATKKEQDRPKSQLPNRNDKKQVKATVKKT